MHCTISKLSAHIQNQHGYDDVLRDRNKEREVEQGFATVPPTAYEKIRFPFHKDVERSYNINARHTLTNYVNIKERTATYLSTSK